MTTRPEQLEHLSSQESLKAIAVAADPDPNQNRNSNMTMIGHPLPNHSVTHLGSPLSQEQRPLTPVPSNRGPLGRFIHSELGRFLVSVVYFAVVCIAMAFCNQFSDHRWVDTNYTRVFLRDRGFDILPAMADITPANVFVMTSVVFTLIGMAIICPTWTARVIVLRRVMWVVGTLSVYRALTLSVTTLPTPKENCSPATKRDFGDMFWIALQMIPGTVQACTDDIFSGHTVFMVTCAIQWRLYCKNKWVTYFSYAYITVGLFFVVATRLHYTVDVVLAIFITYAVWSLYMAMIDVVMEKEYFGLQRHHEKYRVFDTLPSSPLHHQQKSDLPVSRRAQLEHRMNRMRGPGIGYQRSEYDRVAFVPMQYNTWLTGLVRWCDGLDLRMRPTTSTLDSPSESRWQEYCLHHRAGLATVLVDPSPQKDEQDSELNPEQDPEKSEMSQVRHGRDPTLGPMMLDSIHIVRRDQSTPSSSAEGKMEL